jgi:hypothetical protein
MVEESIDVLYLRKDRQGRQAHADSHKSALREGVPKPPSSAIEPAAENDNLLKSLVLDPQRLYMYDYTAPHARQIMRRLLEKNARVLSSLAMG